MKRACVALLFLTACVPGVRVDPSPATLERVRLESGFDSLRVSGGLDLIRAVTLRLRAVPKGEIHVNDPHCVGVPGGVTCTFESVAGYSLPYSGEPGCASLEYSRERKMPTVYWPEGQRCN